MDPLLLEYYNRELVYMREKASEFARQHPKIAKRLGMQGIEVADPYVERLIEAFCFMSARMQIKQDAEFPRFSQRLLEVVYPNYTCPTPSMSVAQLHPSQKEGDFSRGFLAPRDTRFFAKVPEGEQTACEFRSGQDVMLWPVAIKSAQLTETPPDIPALDRYLPPHFHVEGALRLVLTINMKGGGGFSSLVGLDRLPIYLCGAEAIASHLFELLHTSAIATFTGAFGSIAKNPHVVLKDALTHEGLAPGQNLLPLNWNCFHGHNLLHEYFACPSRFYFFTLTGLAPGLARIQGQEAEIVILLSKSPNTLAAHVNARQFALYCTPIINLFERRTDRIEINTAHSEFHLVPDRTRPMDYEVFSVREIRSQRAETSDSITFRPLFQTLNRDEGNYGHYFSTRRERRLPSDSARKYGTRTPYTSTEVFVSLVDQHEAPFNENIRYLSVLSLLTNRDLPILVPRNGVSDLRASDSIPVTNIGLIRPPSSPHPPFAEREMAWRLIRQLGFNYLPLIHMPSREAGQALRELLRMYIPDNEPEALRQVQALVGSDIKPVTRRLPGSGPLIYGRGVSCKLTVDEDGFSGISPYLFALVLEHWLARHVAINVFTQTELHSMQRGKIFQWPVRTGGRGIT
jgi:type VI secretion system protein ImpG